MLTDNRAFYEALGRAETPSIKLLAEKIGYNVRQTALQARLSPEDAEELLNDAVVITIANIRNGKFQFTEFSPVTYAKGVVRKLIANRLRSVKPESEAIGDLHLPSDLDADIYLQDRERQAIVGKLLNQMGESCRVLIHMKYFNQLKDEEIIHQGLTIYTSVGSLKSKRSQCLKKLAEIARQAGINEVF